MIEESRRSIQVGPQNQIRIPLDAIPLVSIIVVNCNRLDLLRRCISSVEKQQYPNFELIVVDNGSMDGSLEYLRALTKPALRIVENRKNRGFCAANNQAVRIARGEYVALLNNDAEADCGWLQELVRALSEHRDFGMAASKILTYDNRKIIDKSGHLIYLDGQNRGRGTGEYDIGQYDQREEVAWPDGSAALYRRAMLEQIGGFDEDFYAYADDAELGLRARIAGWRCIYVPTAVVYHRLGSTLGPYSEQRLFLIERNRVWLAAKLFPLRLLLLNPFYFGLRMLASAWAAVLGRGESARAKNSISLIRLVKCVVKANLVAWARVPAMLRKRASLNAMRKLSPAEVEHTIRRFQIPLADLVFKSR